MTTIAWDGTTLAADTLCTGPDDDGVYYGTKIWKTPVGLFGGCGDEDPIQEVLEWLRDGMPKDRKPGPYTSKKQTFGGLLIRPNKVIVLISSRLGMIEYFEGQKVVLGTGGSFALAFMHQGLTAPEAIAKVIELKLDINTGGKIEQLGL